MSTKSEPITKFVLFWKQIKWKSLLYNAILLPCMAMVYWTVNAQGLRMTVPAFATKLHKVPGAIILGLGRWRIFHDLDVAPFFALVMLAFVFISTTIAFKILLHGVSEKCMNPAAHTAIVFGGAVGLILFDAMIFYRGLLDQLFFGQGIQFVPLLMTIGYSVTLAYAAYYHVLLHYGDEP